MPKSSRKAPSLSGLVEARERLKGATIPLVLEVLRHQKHSYGYEIIKQIEARSAGLFQLGEGTLYPLLHSLEGDGLVESEWRPAKSGRKRKYYTLTREGHAALSARRRSWRKFRDAVDLFLASEASDAR